MDLSISVASTESILVGIKAAGINPATCTVQYGFSPMSTPDTAPAASLTGSWIDLNGVDYAVCQVSAGSLAVGEYYLWVKVLAQSDLPFMRVGKVLIF